MSIYTCAICHKDKDSDWVGCEAYNETDLICLDCHTELEESLEFTAEHASEAIRILRERTARHGFEMKERGPILKIKD